MVFKATQFCDCQTVIKTFERAAAYCPTEESVFAMLCVPLQNIRTSAGAFVEQSELDLIMASPTTAKNKNNGSQEQSAGVGTNDDKATEDDGGFLQKLTDVSEAFTSYRPESINKAVDNIEAADWYKNCINCDIRPGTLEELMLQAGVNGVMDSFLNAFIEMWQQVLAQIESMKDLFNGDPYLDLCAFIRWMKEYVCIPDLARIISVLMALLSKMAFDFGGVVGIIISLVAPLVQPFLTNLVNSLEKFIFMVLKPIECIIDKLQMLLASGGEIFTIVAETEHSSIAKNISKTEIPVTTRRDGKVIGNALAVDLHEGDATTHLDASFGLQERINAKKAENQQKVEDAARKLESLDNASKNVDTSNPKELERYNNKRKEAQSEYQTAVEKRDFSTIQRANKRINEGRKYVRSIILEFIKYLREAVRSLEAYVNQLWDELKKLTLEFGGGHNSFIGDLVKKMGIVQIIQLVYSLIQNNGLKGCDEQGDDVSVSSDIGGVLSIAQSNLTVWTDEEGNIHIEDNNDGLIDAIDVVLEAHGSTQHSGNKLTPLANTQDLRQTDRGNYVTDARQKLNSLIQLTGDPTLDSQIARTTEAAVSRTNITFKCPLQTSVSNAEQVNKWISELNK